MNVIPKDLGRLLDESGVEVKEHREIDHGTQHVLARGSERATLNVYRTGNVSEGGKSSGLRDLLRDWRLSRSETDSRVRGSNKAARGSVRPTPPDARPRVGTDEAGKGEYLGPLVVAGARVLGSGKDRELREMGVRDSKTLEPGQVPKMAAGILGILGPENVRVLALAPEEYEARREAADSNVNKLLGELNAELIGELEGEIEVAVVDAFGTKARSYVEPRVPGGLRLEVRPKAEDDAAVAAASILARARYLEEMDRLSERIGFELPRGSTHVLGAARRVYEERGMEGLREVAKVHFATTEQVTAGARPVHGRGGGGS